LTTIGVLAIQGDFAEHLAVLRELDIETREIRLPGEQEGLDGLIIPGGESTTLARLMDVYGLREPLKRRVLDGMAGKRLVNSMGCATGFTKSKLTQRCSGHWQENCGWVGCQYRTRVYALGPVGLIWEMSIGNTGWHRLE